jgi:hypothetical protein
MWVSFCTLQLSIAAVGKSAETITTEVSQTTAETLKAGDGSGVCVAQADRAHTEARIQTRRISGSFFVFQNHK